jgi:DNA-directed RNA polymerase subunit RPC12/RpoP
MKQVTNQYMCDACEQEFATEGEAFDLNDCPFCGARDIDPYDVKETDDDTKQ